MSLPQKSPLDSPVLSALLAVGGGLLWSLCFGREPSAWLPWVALVPLALLLMSSARESDAGTGQTAAGFRSGDRRAALWGWLFGLVAWLASLHWIVPTLMIFGALPRALGVLTLGLLALCLGFYQAVFVFFGRRIWRHNAVAALWILPALWVALEWLREVAFSGFPWNLAAYAWVEMPGALPLSAWVGAAGISYLLVAANVALADAWTRRRFEGAAVAVLLPLLVLILAGRFSDGAIGAPGDTQVRRPQGAQIRIIQPNSPIVASAEAARESYLQLIAMSQAECRSAAGDLSPPDPVLLVWPESAAWPFSFERSGELRGDVARLNADGCDVLLGSVTTAGSKYFNTALLVSGGASVGEYAKRKLVPWGEYVPLGDVLPFIDRLARNAGDFAPGRSPVLLPWGDERIGVAICYEVIFGAAVAKQVRDGATVLVTITNDAWYGDTSAPWQHFRAARFRAAENRRPLLRAALTGVSGLIDRRGQPASRLGVGEQGALRGRVRGNLELTPYSRAPWLVPLVCSALAAFAIVRAWRADRSL